MKVKFILIFLICLMADGKNLRADGDEFSISYCEYHVTHKFAIQAVREAYRRINIQPTFAARPCRRSLIEANAGTYDGEIARITGTYKAYPNLIEISSPAIDIEGVAVTTSSTKSIQNWADLTGLRVGIMRGELYAEKGTANFKVSVASSYDQLLRMLLRGRIEIAIVIRRDWELIMKSPQFFGENIRIIGEPLFSANLHHLIHKKHTSIVKELDRVFQEMSANGDTDRIHNKTMQMLSPK